MGLGNKQVLKGDALQVALLMKMQINFISSEDLL